MSYGGGGRLRCPTGVEEGQGVLLGRRKAKVSYWGGGRLRCPTGEEEG